MAIAIAKVSYPILDELPMTDRRAANTATRRAGSDRFDLGAADIDGAETDRRHIDSASRYRRVRAALLAGAIAIFLNMAMLAVADWLNLPTAHGGLLRLLTELSGDRVRFPAGPVFQAGFHVLVGLAMAVFYALCLEPALRPVSRWPAWLGGLTYAGVVWIANAALVLPLTGEGFAGSRHLSLAGMVWFAAAHTLFFVSLALLFQQFSRPSRKGV
jgi:hypothetical protein